MKNRQRFPAGDFEKGDLRLFAGSYKFRLKLAAIVQYDFYIVCIFKYEWACHNVAFAIRHEARLLGLYFRMILLLLLRETLQSWCPVRPILYLFVNNNIHQRR